MIQLIPSRGFSKCVRAFPEREFSEIQAALSMFAENPHHPSLHFKKLGGIPKKAYYSIRASKFLRIVLLQISEVEYELIDVGPRREIYKRLRQ